MKLQALTATLTLTLALSLFADAGNWPQWRGPNFNGTAEEKELPTQWSQTEGVKWSVDMPGISGATPVVWGDRVFVMSPDKQKEQLLICISRKDGKVLWKQSVAGGMLDKGKGNSTSPSPITDGKTVWAFVGTGQLAAFDMDGKQLWLRDLAKDYGKFAIMWTYGSSPLLFAGKLYVQVLQRTPAPNDYPGLGKTDAGDRESFVLALDPVSGKTLWKHVRPSDSIMESMESYSTPIPHTQGGKTQILIAGGDVLSGHDAETGAELWRGGGINNKKGKGGGEWMRIVPSPVSAGEVAVVCGPKQSAMIAFKTDGKGDVTESGKAWAFDERKTPDCTTPAYHDGKLFVLDGDVQVMTCLDAKSGAKVWQVALTLDKTKGREIFRASPTVVDGKIYSLGERGTVVVQKESDGSQISVIAMGGEEGARSSIAVSDGQLFIRTTDKLWCIGK